MSVETGLVYEWVVRKVLRWGGMGLGWGVTPRVVKGRRVGVWRVRRESVGVRVRCVVPGRASGCVCVLRVGEMLVRRGDAGRQIRCQTC